MVLGRVGGWMLGLTAVLATAATAAGATPVRVESADGKTLLTMDDPALGRSIQEVMVDGKTVLYIQGNNLLVNPSAPPTLVLDGNDVRPGGVHDVILARFDGSDLRHGKGGAVLMNYRHPDLCPDAAANRLYVVRGPELNHAQLVAALYVARPDLFKLTDAETAEQKKAYAAAGAESDQEAAKDKAAMKWMVLNGHGPLEHINKGTITFAAKKNDAYPATFDYTADGGPSLTGVAIGGAVVSAEMPVWVAYGTPKTIGMCAYKIDGGKLTGTWHTWYDDGTAKSLGSEQLDGPATLDGDYKITDAKAPTTGAAYTGTVTIKPLDITGAVEGEKPYAVTWTIGTAKVQGIGIRTGDMLYVASGSGADTLIAKITIANGSFNGDFYKLGSTEQGGLAATN